MVACRERMEPFRAYRWEPGVVVPDFEFDQVKTDSGIDFFADRQTFDGLLGRHDPFHYGDWVIWRTDSKEWHILTDEDFNETYEFVEAIT